ncbi:MAG: hypothetical protein U0L98_06525 [Clostridia bacterium]|nr:hypothetical protein [Clostridia bacterium]
MLIPIFVEKKLDEEVKVNIKNKKYSEEELKEIYNTINSNLKNAKSGFICNAILFLLIFGFIGYKIVTINSKFLTFGIGFSLVCYSIVVLIFYMNITSSKRKFLKLVKENYSNDIDWE